jgi:hypothetical protein
LFQICSANDDSFLVRFALGTAHHPQLPAQLM